MVNRIMGIPLVRYFGDFPSTIHLRLSEKGIAVFHTFLWYSWFSAQTWGIIRRE